jgi:DNA polymerase III delta subunit
MIHLLVGPDRFLVHEELGRILHSLDPEGLNTTRFDSSVPVSDVANAVATAAFFGEGRVIVAEGVMERSRPTGKGRRVDKSDLESLFIAVAPGNTLILVDPDLETVPRQVRDAAGKDATQFGGRVPRESQLIEWVREYVTSAGARIERRVAERLLQRLFPGAWRSPSKNPAYDSPPDLMRLSRELDKLVTAASQGEVSARDVDELVAESAADELFPLIDAVIQGRAQQAITLLLKSQPDDDGASRLLNQLVANAELGQIAAAARDLSDAAQRIGLQNPNRLSAIQRTFSRLSAQAFAEDVIASDRRLKTGYTRSPTEQLHEVLVRRARKTRDR